MSGSQGEIPPIEIGYAHADTVSEVAKIADKSSIAIGFSDGSLQIGEVRGGTTKIARPSGGAAITTIGAPEDSSLIFYGTACGCLGKIEVCD